MISDLNLRRKELYLFIFPKKVEIVFAYSKTIHEKYCLPLLIFSLDVDMVSPELC